MGRPKLIGPLTASETKKKKQREKWYADPKNKELTKKRALESKRRTQEWFKEEKKKYECSHCKSKGYGKLGFYDLSHSRVDQVSELVGRGSRKKIKEEMESRTCICESCWHLHYTCVQFHFPKISLDDI
tara:strand:- start:297 stop:683 length:387 start_codon:yes stop_codon:yes gene_type:complete